MTLGQFRRYALYYVPSKSPWSSFATGWLGWDIETGRDIAHPIVKGLDVPAITAVPRDYGLHATIRSPFVLTRGTDCAALDKACTRICADLATMSLDGLRIARIGRFVALRPREENAALTEIAAVCVAELDRFRESLSEDALARHRAAELTSVQQDNLVRWGYPYVMEEFRFHLTLTGRLDRETGKRVMDVLGKRLAPLLPTRLAISGLALVGEGNDGRFRLIRRYPFGA